MFIKVGCKVNIHGLARFFFCFVFLSFSPSVSKHLITEKCLLMGMLYFYTPTIEKYSRAELATVCLLHLTLCPLALLNNCVIAVCQ